MANNENYQNNMQIRDESDTFKITKLWGIVLATYIILLIGIGYIAFWDQDFNKPENTIGKYVTLLNDHQNKAPSGEKLALSNEEFAAIVQEIMKKNLDNAGDLQELASQSFNIVLGAILAFLSGSVGMIFQRINNTQKTVYRTIPNGNVDGSQPVLGDSSNVKANDGGVVQKDNR